MKNVLYYNLNYEPSKCMPMHRLLRLLLITFIALVALSKIEGLWPSRAPKEPTVAIANPHLTAFTRAYASFIESEMERTHTPGAAVVIVKDSSIVFIKGFGVKKAGGRDSVDTHTLFRIGSLSKGFAGVLAAQLEQEHYFDLEDPVLKFIPDFQLHSPEQTRRIRVRHLISHSIGLPYHTYTNLVESGEEVHTIAQKFRNVRLIGKEGEVFSYQNAAFSLIEEVIRQTYGKPYSQALEEKIFSKAGMQDASTSYEEITASSNKALPHDGFDNDWVPTDITHKYYNTIAAGGVNASIADMGQWLQLLLGNRPDIIGAATLDKAFSPLVKTNNERRFFQDWKGNKEAYYGLGWRIFQTDIGTVVYHGGYVNSYRGEIAIHPETKIGICVLVNGAGTMPGRVIPAFFEKYASYIPSIQAWNPTSVQVKTLSEN